MSKFYGSYDALANTVAPASAVNNDLAGAIGHDLTHFWYSEVDLWNRIKGADPRAIVTNFVDHSNAYGGIMTGHLFTLVKLVELSNGTRLAKIRNPFGFEWYRGPWSDGSSEWTDEFK